MGYEHRLRHGERARERGRVAARAHELAMTGNSTACEGKERRMHGAAYNDGGLECNEQCAREWGYGCARRRGCGGEGERERKRKAHEAREERSAAAVACGFQPRESETREKKERKEKERKRKRNSFFFNLKFFIFLLYY